MSDHFDFGLTDSQQLIRQNIRALLRRELPWQKVQVLDEACEFPFEAYQALADEGWLGLLYPEEFGGVAGSFKDFEVFIEAAAYENPQMASGYMTTVVYGGMQILMGGSDKLRQEILPKVVSGDVRLSICLSEPDTGSDAGGIRTRAVADGDDYVINGQKVWITCAHVADYLVVATKTDPDAHNKGITLFCVDANAPGVTINPLKMVGRHMITTNEIFFDNVRVPKDRMLGELNGGWKNLMRGLNLERTGLAAAAAGNMQRIVAESSRYAAERVQFGRSIDSFQAISHKLADMQVMAEAATAMTRRVADMLDAGLEPNMETAATKIYATEHNVKCADLGIQVFGGAGYSMSGPLQMWWRDARVGPIGGGTSEVMRTIVAKSLKQNAMNT